MIEQVGSFFVGGRRLEVVDQEPASVRMSGDLPDYLHDPNGIYDVEHAYVQYLIPSEARHLPLVLVHGGGMTGAVWESTPDGRPGWMTRFLRAGFPVYVVDNVERGRAGWVSIPGAWSEPIARSELEMWDDFRIGSREDYPKGIAYPDSTFPMGALHELTRQLVPRWTDHREASVSAIGALIERLGRCFVLGHSQGGGFVAEAAAHTDLVAAAVLVEPHGLPTGQQVAQQPQLLVMGDHLDATAMYRELGRAWRAYRAANDGVALLDLPQQGIRGNSHVPMCDLNSDEVADAIAQWLAAVPSTTIQRG